MALQNGGGAATASGMDFQQRTAAFFVLSMALDLDCASILERSTETKIQKVAFETLDHIDDIVLTHHASRTFLQAKRKISLSDSKASEFCSVIKQFVGQYLASQNSDDRYCLITSPESSKKINLEMRNLAKSSRLSSSPLASAPLSQAAAETLRKINACIDHATSALNSKPLNTIDKQALLSKIHIITLDIEDGGIYESAFLTSIACQLATSPELLWNFLISQTLSWAKLRKIVDKAGIADTIGQFIATSASGDSTEQDLFTVLLDPNHHEICSGYEVFLLASQSKDYDYELLAEPRFETSGERRHTFRDSEIMWRNGREAQLHGRFSTQKGAIRYLSEIQDFRKKKVLAKISTDPQDLNQSKIALAYSDKVRKKMLANKEISKCMHCGKGLSHRALSVEVDEEGLPFDVGIIHRECLRSSDRVLGICENRGMNDHPELRNFDYKKWFSILSRSQALWGSFHNIHDPIKQVLWNPKNSTENPESHCIKITLSDGSFRFMLVRGQVHRMTANDAEKTCEMFRTAIKKQKQLGDPLCYSIDGEVFGTEDYILRHTSKPTGVIECLKFQKTTYTRGISELYDTCSNYYAPLLLLSDERGNPLIFKNRLLLLTNPWDLNIFLKNWETAGYSPKNYSLTIIETDSEAEKLFHSALLNGTHIVVDGTFDKTFEIIRGAEIHSFSDFQFFSARHILFTIENTDAGYTQILRDNHTEVAMLLSQTCKDIECSCFGCQIYEAMFAHYGAENVSISHTTKGAQALIVEADAIGLDVAVFSKSVTEWDIWDARIFDRNR